jgi:hypothetical protein
MAAPTNTADVKKSLANLEPSTHGPFRRSLRRKVMSEIEVSAQPVDATQALNLSAGVSNVKVLRGRSLS